MKFESARDLKEEALARFVDLPVAPSTGLGGRLWTSGTRLTAAVARVGDHLPDALWLPGLRSTPSFGLGVAVSEPGDYKLAIRYPWLDESQAPHLDELTEMARGEVDVNWIGPIRVAAGAPGRPFRCRRRPLMIGSSVAHDGGTAGTLCAFVQRGGGAPELLSCNHVLADCDRIQPNAAILQPGPADGGQPKDLVGRLAYAYPFEQHAVNVVDCAVATLDTGIAGDHSSLEDFGVLKGVATPDWYSPNGAKQPVAKIGRTTGTTEGRITALSFTGEIEFPVGPRMFTDMIEIEGSDTAFADLGDSGSLVFTAGDRLAVGMIIAVAEGGKSYMTRFDTVLSRLGAQLAI